MIIDPNNRKPDNDQELQTIDKVKIIASNIAAQVRDFFLSLPDRFRSGYDAYKDKSAKKLRRTSRERIYRLKGYTTVAKINRKRHAERQQRFLRKFLFIIIAVILVMLVFAIYNPFKDLSEVKKILGIESVDDLTRTNFIIETTPDETNETDLVINTDINTESSEDEETYD